jgi:transcriptional regulator with XRE-family HTH domain
MHEQRLIIARNVRAARNAQGLSQEALARRADRSLMTVFHVEAGDRDATLGTLQAIAGALGVELAELLEE